LVGGEVEFVLELELFQGPVVFLRHILLRGRKVSLREQQSSKPYPLLSEVILTLQLLQLFHPSDEIIYPCVRRDLQMYLVLEPAIGRLVLLHRVRNLFVLIGPFSLFIADSNNSG